MIVVEDDEPGYWQASKMTRLAERYATEGEWVIPFDADELWHGLDNLTGDYDTAWAHPHVHIGTARLSGCEPYPKVAFRWRHGARIEMGNHFVSGAGNHVLDDVVEVCHHQYRSLEQVRRKVRNGVAAYQATDLPAVYGSHWRALAAMTDVELEQWWAAYTEQAVVPCLL